MGTSSRLLIPMTRLPLKITMLWRRYKNVAVSRVFRSAYWTGRGFVVRIFDSYERKILAHKLTIRIAFATDYLCLLSRLCWVRVFQHNREIVVVSQVVHMGDIVACEPVLRQIRTENPAAFLIACMGKPYRDLADSHPEVDYTLAVRCVTEWIWFQQSRLFDRVVDLNTQGRKCLTCGIRLQKVHGDLSITGDTYYAYGSLLACFSRAAGLVPPVLTPQLYIPSAVVDQVNREQLPACYVVIHCSSNDSSRDLPVEKWRQIVAFVNRQYNLPLVEVGLSATALAHGPSPNIDRCGKLSILQTAEVIRRSCLFIGVDSGPAHLANAVGIYGIIMLGHYRHFQRYMPYTGNFADPSRADLLYNDSGPAAEIPVARICDAVDRRMRSLSIRPRPEKVVVHVA